MDLEATILELNMSLAAETTRDAGGAVCVRVLHPAGTGVMYARSATVGSSGVEVQIRRLAAWCGEHSHVPRVVVAACGVSGALPYTKRADLHAVVGEAASGAAWIVALNACCVARRTEPLLAFLTALHDYDAHLFLRNMGGAPLVGTHLNEFLEFRREDERARFIAHMREHAKHERAPGTPVCG